MAWLLNGTVIAETDSDPLTDMARLHLAMQTGLCAPVGVPLADLPDVLAVLTEA